MSVHNQPPDEPASNRGEVTVLTIFGSVAAAFFGVQSNANRKRDFESGKFWYFLAAGLVFVLLFLGAVWIAVQAIIATTG